MHNLFSNNIVNPVSKGKKEKEGERKEKCLQSTGREESMERVGRKLETLVVKNVHW